MRGLRVLLTSLVAAAASLSAADQTPAVSLWYRGQPAGVARAEDLAAIRAQGFTAVTWPLSSATGLRELTRLAEEAGLTVVVRPDPVALTPASARQTTERVDIIVSKLTAAEIAPLAWRAIAHGARLVSLDPGVPEGTGLLDRAGRPPAWLAPATDIARQLRINGGLIAQLRPTPDLRIDPPVAPALDVTLLEAQKSWVAIATNTSRVRVRAAVRLPADVPYALWLHLLNGSTLAMLSQPTGPRWNVDLEPWGVRVYVIDKTLR